MTDKENTNSDSISKVAKIKEKKDDKGESKVMKTTHELPDEKKNKHKSIILGSLLVLSIIVFIFAVMVVGKKAFIDKQQNENNKEISMNKEQGANDNSKLVENNEQLSGDNEQTDNQVVTDNSETDIEATENENIIEDTTNEVTTEEEIEENIIEEEDGIDNTNLTGSDNSNDGTSTETFIIPENSNKLLEGKTIEEMENEFKELKKLYDADKNNVEVKTKISLESRYLKIINYFQKKYPDENITNFFVGDPYSYFFITTEEKAFFLELIQDIAPNGEEKTSIIINEIEGIDMETFQLFDRYSKDKNYVYRDYKKIDEADAKTFVAFNRNYAKDKNNIYILGEIMKNVDYNSFEILSEDYAKDKDNIYTYERILEKADVESFEVIDEYTAKDKNYVYGFGEIMEGEDPNNY